MKVRLQKFLAEAGVASRRASEDLIRAGRVTVDGVVATLGSSVDPQTQIIAVDGRPLVEEKREYWLLNKPAGVLSAASDARGRRTVVDLVPTRARIFPVGRLDLNSTGLLLLTNDGEMAALLLHPRYHVDKEYIVTVRGAAADAALGPLRRGLQLEDGPTAPAKVDVIRRDRSATRGATTTLRVVIHEGRKRQVRRMFEAIGHRVVSLHRSRFAGLTDGDLAPGQARPLAAREIETLRRTVSSR